MKKDIETRDDIVELLHRFYEKAFGDELIGRFFTEVVPLDIRTHIPVIADFWEAVVFNTHSYKKNVMEVHQHIHKISPIKKEHLDRWVHLFVLTINEKYDGPKATIMKQRGSSIAVLMDIKMNHSTPNSII